MRKLAALALVAAPDVGYGGALHDIDGDGFDDATVGAMVRYGSAKGLSHGEPPPVSPRVKDLPMFHALTIVGDVDGDGFADVVLGDPGCPDFALQMPACETGAIYVFRGGPKRLAAAPAQTITTDKPKTLFGWHVVALGDIDGDGKADVAVPASDGIHVFLGSAKGLVAGPVIAGSNGFAIGDIDGDHRADLLALGPAGATIVFGGDLKRTQAVPLAKDARPFGTATGGDFDGDGFADLVIAVEPASMATTELLVYRGGPHGLATKPSRLASRPDRHYLGSQLASVGDLDGDGRDDLVAVAGCTEFVAKESSCRGGTAFVYLGSAKGLVAKPVATLPPRRGPTANPGGVIQPLGDIDGDHHADFAWGNYIYRGARGGLADREPPPL